LQYIISCVTQKLSRSGAWRRDRLERIVVVFILPDVPATTLFCLFNAPLPKLHERIREAPFCNYDYFFIILFNLLKLVEARHYQSYTAVS